MVHYHFKLVSLTLLHNWVRNLCQKSSDCCHWRIFSRFRFRESMENLLASQHSGGVISALSTGHIRTPPTLSTAHTHSDHNPSFSSTFPTITSANSSNCLTSFMQQMLTSSLAHRDFPPNPPLPSNSAVAMLAYLQLVHSLSGHDSSQSEWTDRDSVS